MSLFFLLEIKLFFLLNFIQYKQCLKYIIASQIIKEKVDDDTLCEVCKLVAQDLEQILDEDSTQVDIKDYKCLVN